MNNSGTGTARFSFGSALHQEFILRGYDYSAIGDSNTLSFSDEVRLKNKSIIKIRTRKKYFKKLIDSPICQENNVLDINEQIKLSGDNVEYVERKADKPLVAKSSKIFPRSDFNEPLNI